LSYSAIPHDQSKSWELKPSQNAVTPNSDITISVDDRGRQSEELAVPLPRRANNPPTRRGQGRRQSNLDRHGILASNAFARRHDTTVEDDDIAQRVPYRPWTDPHFVFIWGAAISVAGEVFVIDGQQTCG
jgi:hypothetical protein